MFVKVVCVDNEKGYMEILAVDNFVLQRGSGFCLLFSFVDYLFICYKILRKIGLKEKGNPYSF